MWKDLTMQQRADVIRMAVEAGLRDMESIRSFYDSNNRMYKGGSYLDWKKRASEYKHLNIDGDNTYDYEGWYNENPQRAWDFLNDKPEAHFEDKYKTVYHPTFSTESIYSGKAHPKFNPKGLRGGSWTRDNKFIMSPDGYEGPVSMDERQSYLIDAEDYGVQLREADGSLPIYDGIPWGGVLPNVTISPKKFGGGGIFEDLGLGSVGTTLDDVTSYLPIASSLQDTYSFIKEPSWENLGWAAASIGADLVGAGLLKGVKAATKVYKTAKKSEEAAKKALETHRKTNRNIRARSIREEDRVLQNAYNDARAKTALSNPFWDKVIEYPIAGGWITGDAGMNYIQNSNKKSSGGPIHIAPSKKGTFTAAATKHGMGVQEFANKVLANKDNYSSTMVKKANFARNASKWKH